MKSFQHVYLHTSPFLSLEGCVFSVHHKAWLTSFWGFCLMGSRDVARQLGGSGC